ncbi:MAG: right-handed parallel beta-helix repeat-containing protein, partial [Oscillospiraceae bacterium]|nr:right-handed parallel beta-helix repeat-containing protein [Oscillospiraceae bacterium]
TLGDGSHSTQTVDPFIVELYADMEALGFTFGEGVDAGMFTIEVRLPHGVDEGADYDPPEASPWEYDGDLYLRLDGWLKDGSRVTSVHFDPHDPDSRIRIKADIPVPIHYDAGVTIADDKTLKGAPPQTPDPSFVAQGTEHTLLPISWYRENFIAVKWNVSTEAKLIPSGNKLKVVFEHSDLPDFDGKAPGDKIVISIPTEIKPVWNSKWSYVDYLLNSKGSCSLDDEILKDVKAAKKNKTMNILRDATLDLNGHKLSANGIDNRSYKDPMDLPWLNYTEVLNAFNVVGCSLTVKDSSDSGSGTVTNGANIIDGGCVYVGSGGSFTLESGTVKANSTVNFALNDGTVGELRGGAVYISSGGTAYIKGGKITENVAYGDGGGVYIADGAELIMSGGEISSNEAGLFVPVDATKEVCAVDGRNGGGVYVGGTFKVSGKVIIKDNKASNETSNVYLPSGKVITVAGKLDKDAEIHVSMQSPGVITSGLRANSGDGAQGSASNFVSDDESYVVVIGADGEAELVSKEHTVTVEDTEHGSVTSDHDKADKGDTVTLSIAPDAGYDLKADSLTAKYTEAGEEKSLTLTQGTGEDTDKYTFTMPEADVTVTAEFEKSRNYVSAANISLGGELRLNFKVMVGDSRTVKAVLKGSKGSEVYAADPVYYDLSDMAPVDGMYVFTYKLYGTQMGDKVTLTLKNANGDTLPLYRASDRVRFDNDAFSFSINDYLDLAKASDRLTDKQKRLAGATYTYGAYAANYFDIGADLTKADPLPGITADSISRYAIVPPDDLPETVTIAGMDLRLDSRMTARIYFKVSDGIKSHTIKLDGKSTTVRKSGDRYCVAVNDIAADKLTTAHTLTIDGVDISFYPISYAYIVLKNASTDNKLCDTVKAVYAYGLAADALTQD